MKTVIVLSAFLFLGCEAQKPNPRKELVNYKCNPEQVKLVENQFKICNESSYISSYCYLTALANNCEYIGE